MAIVLIGTGADGSQTWTVDKADVSTFKAAHPDAVQSDTFGGLLWTTAPGGFAVKSTAFQKFGNFLVTPAGAATLLATVITGGAAGVGLATKFASLKDDVTPTIVSSYNPVTNQHTEQVVSSLVNTNTNTGSTPIPGLNQINTSSYNWSEIGLIALAGFVVLISVILILKK